MGLLKAAGNMLGFLFLGVAGIAAVYRISMVGLVLLWGPTKHHLGGIVLAVPVVMMGGVFGVVIRKVVAGTVLPIDYAVSDAYRSFIGGSG